MSAASNSKQTFSWLAHAGEELPRAEQRRWAAKELAALRRRADAADKLAEALEASIRAAGYLPRGVTVPASYYPEAWVTQARAALAEYDAARKETP